MRDRKVYVDRELMIWIRNVSLNGPGMFYLSRVAFLEDAMSLNIVNVDLVQENHCGG